MDEYVEKIAVPQVRELMSNYGPGVPAVLWWDQPMGLTTQHVMQLEAALVTKA